MKPLVIYHANCTDGFGAAFAAWLKLGDKAEYLPAAYGEHVDFDPRNREIYILDFSFTKERMDFLFEYANRVVWLDHHKTAFEMWCGGMPREGFYETFTESPDWRVDHCILLDNNKSGAMLAWEYFHPETDVPDFIKLIDDRDRWQFKLEGSREFHAALASYKPWSFEQWEELNSQMENWDDIVGPHFIFREGATLIRSQNQHVEDMAKQSRACHVKWVPPGELSTRPQVRAGLAVNATLHISEVGHALANQSGTYGLVWYLGADGKCKCSLRSNGDYDVSAIAKVFGGGGHKNAAGFETDITTLMGWMR